MPYKHGRKPKMMPAVAYAGGHVMRQVGGHGLRRVAAYFAGGAAVGGVGVSAIPRKKAHTKRGHRTTNQTDMGTGAEFSKMTVAYGRPNKERLPAIVRPNLQTTVCRFYWVNPGGYDHPASATTVSGQIPLLN